MEHDEFCPERHLAETERCDTAYCLWCATLREARADERRRVWNTVATLRASAKKDENGWALYEHCYECSGAADGYDTAIDDALRAICVHGVHKGGGERA